MLWECNTFKHSLSTVSLAKRSYVTVYGVESCWFEAYIFILNFSLSSSSLQLGEEYTNETKHDNGPE